MNTPLARSLSSALLGLACLACLPAAAQNPPVAPVEPRDVSVHGDRRIDDYFWIRNREDPRVLDYLKAENAYTDAWLAPHAELRERLYQEMLGRIQQKDEAVPFRRGRWWYFTRTLEGRQYPLQMRRAAVGADRHDDPAAKEEVLLDLNQLAEGKSFLSLGAFEVSPDGRWLAYATDETGGRDFTLHLKNLVSGETLPFSVKDTAGVVWGADNRTLYYVTVDAAKRANKVWRYVVGQSGTDDLVVEEKNELFDIGLRKTRDGRYVLVEFESKDTREVRVLDAHRRYTRLRTVIPRREKLEYFLEHRDGLFYARVNDTGRNFRLVTLDEKHPSLAQARELIAARDDAMLEQVDVFSRHLVVTERVTGNLQLRVRDFKSGDEHRVAFDEPAYTATPRDNAEFDSTRFRFEYTSLTTPPSVYDYDLVSRERVLRKRQPVLGGYDPSRYETRRVSARAADGTEIPISLVYRRDLRETRFHNGPQPVLLYGYGSYGIPMDPRFSAPRISLLDRGVVFAIAHIRGGGDLGRGWYEAAKMSSKATTFSDFVSSAQALIAQGYTQPSQLIIQGGSAGGLLMGAVVNLRPDLFKAVVAQVPFVDVINTMLDDTLPLTTGEYIEWGNPKIPEQYAWMRAYSPYDNLKRGAYPAMLVETGINDSQVAYWEPTKYVAKLRTLKTDSNPLLLRVNLGAGHGGASGRFDKLREVATEYTFMLSEWGVAP